MIEVKGTMVNHEMRFYLFKDGKQCWPFSFASHDAALARSKTL